MSVTQVQEYLSNRVLQCLPTDGSTYRLSFKYGICLDSNELIVQFEQNQNRIGILKHDGNAHRRILIFINTGEYQCRYTHSLYDPDGHPLGPIVEENHDIVNCDFKKIVKICEEAISWHN